MPQDELEGMLAAQLVACHNASMECYRRAMIDSQTFEDRRENLNQANKLSRTYVTLLGLRGRTNFGAALTALPQRTLRPQTGCATPAD